MAFDEETTRQTLGNHVVSGLGGIVNMLERYTAGGLELSAGDTAELDRHIQRLYAVWETQETKHAAGR